MPESSNFPDETSIPINPFHSSLLTGVSDQEKAAMVSDMIATVIGMGEDDASYLDLRLFRTALAEMRAAAKVFSRYRKTRKVAVFGSARTHPDEPEYQLAMEFAHKISKEGYMILTGGGDGIMGAAQKGAGAEKSFGLNIRLPFEQRANKTIDGDSKLINFHYFFTRKLNFIKETHAFVLLPGGFGTLDEGFESLTLMQTGKSPIAPMILLERVNGYYWETWRRFLESDLLKLGLISPSDFNLFRVVHSADEAVEEIRRFYSVFHSYRWLRERLILRVNRPFSQKEIDGINGKFSGFLHEPLRQSVALPEEKYEPHLEQLPRLVTVPDKKDFGTLRLLIDEINNEGGKS